MDPLYREELLRRLWEMIEDIHTSLSTSPQLEVVGEMTSVSSNLDGSTI